MRLILEVLCDYSGKLAFHLTINLRSKICYYFCGPNEFLSAHGGTAMTADQDEPAEQTAQMEVLWHPTGNI